jgi:hypothetical protein
MAKGLPWSVLDRHGDTVWQEYVCECRTEEHAKLIANALNAQEADRKRRKGGAAVVCNGGKS